MGTEPEGAAAASSAGDQLVLFADLDHVYRPSESRLVGVRWVATPDGHAPRGIEPALDVLVDVLEAHDSSPPLRSALRKRGDSYSSPLTTSGDIDEPCRTTVSCSSTSSPSSAATRSKVCVSRSRTGAWSSRGVVESVVFPSRFTLVAAANPCSCGFAGDPAHRARTGGLRTADRLCRTGGLPSFGHAAGGRLSSALVGLSHAPREPRPPSATWDVRRQHLVHTHLMQAPSLRFVRGCDRTVVTCEDTDSET